MLKEEWWKARYKTVDEFRVRCGVGESVANVIAAKTRTEKLKRKFEQVAAQRWGERELGTVLGEELMPVRLGATFLERLAAFSKAVPDVEHAKELLSTARDRRLTVTGASKDTRLRLHDIEEALREAGNRPPLRLSQIGENEGGEEMEEEDEVEEENEVEEETVEPVAKQRKSWNCGCGDEKTVKKVKAALEDLKGKDLAGKMTRLERFDEAVWGRTCFNHIKSIASELEMQTKGLNGSRLVERLITVQSNRHRLEEMIREQETYEWFKMKGRAGQENDRLGPLRFRSLERLEFEFDEAVIWARYGGSDAREKFMKDGNVIVKGLFDWIVKDAELMNMINAEFDMYRHHLREQNGKSNLGWSRNMWHSLVQQVIRQDGAFYGLNVAARPDKNWRLISFPYYTRDADADNSREFKQLNVNIPRFLKSGRGANMVQTAISLDDEVAEGCTMVMPGFHKHVREWWSRVTMRGEDKGELIHDVKKIYKQADEGRFGKFERVMCLRGDVRMTLPQMIHGSTGCVERNRVVFPWLMGLDSDWVLELAECGTWKSVAGAHLLMRPVKMRPWGIGHEFSVGEEGFEGVVEIMGVTALGDALVGRRTWDRAGVLMERDAILGSDERLAWKTIERGRARMKVAWKEAFETMVRVEMEEYGEDSFFVSQGLNK